MARIETQSEMFCGHPARIAGRPSCYLRPKLANCGEMARPVFDLFIEHRSNQLMLSNIRVEMSQQSGDSFPATNSIKKAWAVLIHFVDRKNSQGVAR